MTTINAAFVAPQNWIDKLGHKYEDTMQDPLTGDYYTVEKYKKVLAKAPATQIVLYKMPSDDIPNWCAAGVGLTRQSAGHSQGP